MIKEYCMAIKAKHTIKSNRRLYTKQQKKIMLNLLTNIMSIYNETKVTSGSIDLDPPIDRVYYFDVSTHVYKFKNGSPQPGGLYRSITKWGIDFNIKRSPDGKHVDYYIRFK